MSVNQRVMKISTWTLTLTHCSLNSVASVRLLFSFARKTKDVTSKYYINVTEEYKYNKIQLQQFRVCRTDGSVRIFLPSHSKAIRQKVAKAILTNTLYINAHMPIWHQSFKTKLFAIKAKTDKINSKWIDSQWTKKKITNCIFIVREQVYSWRGQTVVSTMGRNLYFCFWCEKVNKMKPNRYKIWSPVV